MMTNFLRELSLIAGIVVLQASPLLIAQQPSTEVQIETNIDKLRQVRLTVVDAQDQPIAAARVAIQLGPKFTILETQTDATGQAVFQVPSSQRVEEVVAWKDHAGLDYRLYRLSQQQQADVLSNPPEFPAQGETLKLDGAVSLTIRVVDDSERPINGLPLYIWLFKKESEPEQFNASSYIQLMSQSTDANGQLTFNWIPKWQKTGLQIWPQSKAFAKEPGIYYFAKGNGELVMRLARLVPLRGQVVDFQGQAMTGIAVESQGCGYTWDLGSASTTTDANGNYELLVSPEQIYLVIVRDQKFASAPHTGFAVFKDQPIEGKNFVLRPATRFHGLLTDKATQEPIPGERIIVHQGGTSLDKLPDIKLANPLQSKRAVQPDIQHYTTTDAEGRFEFSLGDGSFHLRPPYSDDFRKFTIAGEEELQFDVAIGAPQQVELVGMVISKVDGSARAGVRVSGIPSGKVFVEWEAVSDSVGKFRVKRLTDTTHIYAADKREDLVALIEIPAGRQAVALQLEPAATVTGRLVVGSTGKPLADEELIYGVRITNEKNGTFRRIFGGRVTTDVDGNFVLEGLVSGWDYMLSSGINAQDHPRFLKRIRVESGEQHDLGDIKAGR